MWGLLLGIVAIAIAADCETRIRKLQNRLWESERLLGQLRERLDRPPG